MTGDTSARDRVGRLLVDSRVLAMAVVAGAGCVCLLPAPVSPWLLAAALLSGLLRFPGRWVLVAFLLAALWANLGAIKQIEHRLASEQSGETVWLEGRISGLVSVETGRSRFVLARAGPEQRLRLSWYHDAPELLPGDCIRVQAKVESPHGLANPGSFDYEAWLWRQRIDATGYVKQAGACDRPAHVTIDRLRALALMRIDRILADTPMRGIIEALTLGARDSITDAQWQVLRATGTSHLVAISGLHIGLIAGLLFIAARWLLLRTPLRLPVVAVSAGIALTGATGYALLAGLALPTQRALVMVTVAMLALTSMRTISASRALALAAIAVVAWDPLAVMAPGFWLSFGAVAWLIYLGRFMRRSRWAGFGMLQIGLLAGLLPVTLWFFEQASLVAPLVNALLIPLAGIVVPALLVLVLLALMAPPLGALLLAVAHVLGMGWPVLAAVAAWPGATLAIAAPGPIVLVLALVGAALLFMPRGLPGRWLGVVLIFPAVGGWQPALSGIADGAYRMTVLDVGQGLAVVVRTRRHTLVFDAGPAYRTGFDTGAAVVVPYLRHVRRPRVDILMISHADIDHRGGAAAIEQALDVRNRLGAGGRPCRAGRRWQWDGVDFEIVYPRTQDLVDGDSRNARSCVVRISGLGGSVLLTGDIEASTEKRILQRAPGQIDADVLVVAHHGSASSSTAAFIARVSPQLALISTGWHNRWGFPAPAVVARLHAWGARIANTASGGALMLRVPATGAAPLVLRRWRDVRQRIWQRR